MNPAEYLQYIRRANQQAPLKLIEELRAAGYWLRVDFLPDGRIDGVEACDPPPACFVPEPGVSILHPVPYGAVPVFEVAEDEAEGIRAAFSDSVQ